MNVGDVGDVGGFPSSFPGFIFTDRIFIDGNGRKAWARSWSKGWG